ncbi:MAG TPA: putative quinol monooxygenase [Trebonia sp.]
MAVVVVATLIPVPGFRDEVIAALDTAIGETHAAEEGVLLYALHEGRDGRLVMIEKYADDAAFAAHGKSPALAGLGAALKGKLSVPLDVQVLSPHPAGSAEKGAL